jgi:probable FeS assembly SUF system protein SufT
MATAQESVVLSRDVHIITIPDGAAGVLRQGETVTIHQALGNNYTIITGYGHMVRVAGVDADALGKEVQQLRDSHSESSLEDVEKDCWEVMRSVYDPEIPVNIVDLGLVYHCHIKASETHLNSYEVHIKMTLTAPGCGMGPVIQSDVEKGIRALPCVDKVNVEVVLDPPWSREMMSDVAKVQLNLW